MVPIIELGISTVHIQLLLANFQTIHILFS